MQTILPDYSTLNTDIFLSELERTIQENLTTLKCFLDHPPCYSSFVETFNQIESTLERLTAPLFHLNALVHSPALRKTYTECIKQLTDYEMKIHQNKRLFDTLQTLMSEPLSPEQHKIVKDRLDMLEQSGVHLPRPIQKKIKTLQEELGLATQAFDNHLLDCDTAYLLHLSSEDDLSGLPEATRAYAKSIAEQQGKLGWCLTLSPACYHSVMSHSNHRWIRQALYQAYVTRASDKSPLGDQFNNAALMEKILKLRQEEARLLGFKHASAHSLHNKMLKDPKKVLDFLYDLLNRSYQAGQKELASLIQYAQAHHHPSPLEPWDIAYLSEQQKQTLFSFNDEMLRTYFPIDQVLQGLYHLLFQLFELTFEPVPAASVNTWHTEVKVYAVYMKKTLKGYIYMDLFSRPHKRSGAWMDILQTKVLLNDTVLTPIVTLACNFMPPSATTPCCLSHEEILTLFHEMGHCLHHLLTTVDTFSASGLHGVEWDAVELPSQFFEHWAWDYSTLKTLSKHIVDAQPLPRSLYDILLKTKHYLSAMNLLRQIELALFDFEIHCMPTPYDAEQLTQHLIHLRQKTGLLPHPENYRFAHGFSHIFAGGYAAGYYGYLWSEVLSSDAFSRFEEEGLFNPKISQEFLARILEKGSSQSAEDCFISFRGRAPSIQAFLHHHGIIS